MFLRYAASLTFVPRTYNMLVGGRLIADRSGSAKQRRDREVASVADKNGRQKQQRWIAVPEVMKGSVELL